MAMEAEAAGAPPVGVAARVLEAQEQLIRADLRQRRGLFAAFVLAAVVVLGGAAAMIWSASRANGLVIDPFVVPADLAQAGATGEAVANRLKDRFAAMGEETVSAAAGATLREDLAADVQVKVEFAGAAVSLDEVDRLLRGWLSHETHVRGEVQRVTSGPEQGALALSVRITGRPGERLVQADGNLDALVARAAEQVYAARSPVRFAEWLEGKGRFDEARQVLTVLSMRGTRSERALAYFGLAKFEKLSSDARLSMLRAANWLDPDNLAVVDDLAFDEFGMGHVEAAFHWARRGVWLDAPPGSTPQGARFSRLSQEINLGRLTGDYRPGVELACLAYDVTPCVEGAVLVAALLGPGVSRPGDLAPANRLPYGVTFMALRHATAEARQIIAVHPEIRGYWISAHITTARMSGDWAELARIGALYREAVAEGKAPGLPGSANLWEPLAWAKLGRLDEAEALAASKPRDCQPCMRVHALVAAERRDWAAADRLWAEAVRLSPSTPLALEEWARSLLARGQTDAAIAKAEASVRNGPKYGDAYEVLCEALAAKGDAKGASARFAQAAAITPRWGRLHLKWGEALAKLGKADEARAKWRAAAMMDLTYAERAELAAATGKRPS